MELAQKENFYSNIDYLMKERGIKKTDLEKEAGVSQGYLSRYAQKEDPAAFPAVSFLEFCSRKFGVTMDDLINVRFEEMSATEESIYQFIRKLIEQTQDDDLLWTEVFYWDIAKNIDNCQADEWYEFTNERRKQGPDEEGNVNEVVFIPAKKLNGEGALNGSVFYTIIQEDVRIFFMPITAWNGVLDEENDDLTLWMEIGFNNYNGGERECIARGNTDIFTNLLSSLQKLEKTIKDRKKHIQLDKSFRSVIDSYINQKTTEPQPNLNDFDPNNSGDLPW